MDDRDWSVDGGVGVSWLTDVGLFGLSYVTDLFGRHKGQEMEFSYTVLFRWRGFDFIPSAGMRWKSENLVDYYYGVRPSEALTGRPAFEGEEALDPFVRWPCDAALRMEPVGAVRYEWLDREITDSDRGQQLPVLLHRGRAYSWEAAWDRPADELNRQTPRSRGMAIVSPSRP
jgi:outer membrane protein